MYLGILQQGSGAGPSLTKQRRNPHTGTKVPLSNRRTRVESRAVARPVPYMCEELKALKCEAGAVLRRLRIIRRSRDLSFYEDAELTRLKHASINKVVKHLLVGHDGKPCPSGERPIVSTVPSVKAKATAAGR
jgi:hypothetical protein